MWTVTVAPELGVFRKHVRALFAVKDGIPEGILNQQRRLADKIRSAGLSERLPHLLAGVAEVERRAEEPFELFVLGEGKFGKSTLINALLGTAAAPTDFLPKTWCFNRYIALEKPRCDVRVFVDTSLVETQDCGHLKAMLPKPVGTFRNLVEYRLPRDKAEDIASIEEHKVAESIGSSEPYWSPIMEMEWQVAASNALLPGIRLVDTMGINQKLAPASHLHHLKWQYERADAVLWLVSADKIGAKETRSEIEEASRYAKLLYVIVNRWEEIGDKGEALHRCNAQYGSAANAIVPMSALAAFIARAPATWTPSQRDERWIRKQGNPSRAELEVMSGLPALRQHIAQFLDGRRVFSRNMQVYSALRRKAVEFTEMATATRSDAEANLQLHKDLTARVVEAQKDSEKHIRSTFKSLSHNSLGLIDSGIESIDYDSRNSARAILGLDSIKNNTRLAEQSEAIGATKRYADVLTWVANASKEYVFSEFSATGRVAALIETACTTKTDVEIEATPVQWDIPDPNALIRDFLIGIGEFLSGLPFIGGFMQDRVREAKAKATSEMKQKLRQTVPGQVESYLKRARNRLCAASLTVSELLLEDAESQFQSTGGAETHECTIAKIRGALGDPVVDPVLIATPIKVMKSLGWRCNGRADIR